MKKVILLIIVIIIIVKYVHIINMDVQNVKIMHFQWIQIISNIEIIKHHTFIVMKKRR